MKSKNTVKTIFTICLSVMLIAVQCFGSLMVSAANDSVSYNFDEWEPVEVAGVSGAYQPPSGWDAYDRTYDANNHFYKEDGAMGYKKMYKSSDSNAGVYTAIPQGINKDDFYIDFASCWKNYVTAPQILINKNSPVSIFKLSSYGVSKNSKWQQISVRFEKNAEGTYDATLYVDGQQKATVTKSLSAINEFRLKAETWGDTISGTLEFLLDNVNIRNTPSLLDVTPSVANNAKNVATDTVLTYALSQDINNATLSQISMKDSGGNVVSIEPAYDSRTKTVTINPVLSLNKTYTVDFSKVRDVLGNAPSVSSYTFETVKQRVFVNETFDSYTAEENAFPVSSTGTWSEGKYILSGVGGVFTNTIANSKTTTINPMMKYTLNNAVTEKKLFLEFDYKYTGSGTLDVKLYDSNKSWSTAEWNLKTGISQDDSWHKLQAIITNGTTVNDSSAKIYIDGVYSGETTPTKSKSWNGRLAQIGFQTTIYGNKTSSLSLDNIKLSTLPTELNVTSSLDANSSNLLLGEDITFTFDNPIDTTTVGNAKITAAGVAVGEAEYDEETNTIKFVYAAETPLAENTTYTVDLSGVKDIFGNAPKKSYSFTTVTKAEVKVLENTFSVLEDGEYDVNVDGFCGGEVTATIKAVNTTVKDSKVMIAIAMYDKNFSTMRAVSVEHVTIPCTGAETPVSATLPDDDYEDGDTIKVFVFDAETLKPFKNAFAAGADGVIE